MTIEVSSSDIYPIIIEDTTQGWGGSRFDRRVTTIKARDVGHELHLEIEIDEYKGNRHYQHGSSVALPRDVAAKLGDLLKGK